MKNGIFISYRRKDTEGEASRLTRDLAAALPGVPMFRDVEAISPGEDFAAALERALADCAVMLVMVGPIWLEVTDNNGRRRLDDPKDWTRQEVAGALRRGIRVIPVLCRGAVLPSDADLPDDLDPLINRQAVQIDNNRWDYDVDRLIDSLARALNVRRTTSAGAKAPDTPPSALTAVRNKTARLVRGTVIAFAVLGALVVAGLVAETQNSEPVDPETLRKVLGVIAPPQGGSPTALSANAAGPAPARPAQPVAAAAPSLPDLAGTWRTAAEQWFIRQRGNQLTVAVSLNGVDFGSGTGLIEGNQVGFRMRVQLPVGPIDITCGGIIVSDRLINGRCSSIGGDSPLQLVR